MTIDAAAAGRAAGTREAEATKRRLMAYAAALGAEDECYFDEEGGGGGHRAFCLSLAGTDGVGSRSSTTASTMAVALCSIATPIRPEYQSSPISYWAG